jgi:hypothetical protein
MFLSQTGNGTNGAAPVWAAITKTDVGLSAVENTALSTWAGTSNITTLGTIATGTWNATVIADGKIASALTGKTYNALTLTAAATGFTIAGGTTSKTLTVGLDASVSGTNTGDQTTITGNAGTATALQTARAINGINFDGSANITVPVNSTDDVATATSVYPLWTTAAGNTAAKVSSTKLAFVPSTGVLSATGFSGSGTALTSLTAGNLAGTIPGAVLGNSTIYIGTTAIVLNRTSASQALTGITSIDGSAASVANSITFNTSGGAAAGTTFNGSVARTIDYTTVGAAASGHVHGNITNVGAIGSTANLPLITTTSGVITVGSFGSAANTFCQGNDSRLSDTRNTTNALTINNGGAGVASGSTFNGSTAVTISYNTIGAAAVSHVHGNITSAGAIGSTANLPVITTTSGVLTTSTFGTVANTFCQGNDGRLSDTRNTTNAVTFTTTGGAAAGTTFNGSVASTIDYSTVGAAAASHTHADLAAAAVAMAIALG